MSAQLSKIKATDSDTIMVTTTVEQLTLVLKQTTALGIKKQIITTGGSQNPDQLIDQAGLAANGTLHLTTFAPWYPDADQTVNDIIQTDDTPDSIASDVMAPWRAGIRYSDGSRNSALLNERGRYSGWGRLCSLLPGSTPSAVLHRLRS